MPLSTGKRWTYLVTGPFSARVEPLEVIRRIPLDGTEGADLQGPIGRAKLGWKNGVLFLHEGTQGRFSPPLPLLIAGEEKAKRNWHGRLDSLGEVQPADAALTQTLDEIPIGNRRIKARRSNLVIRLPRSRATLELDTWFESGVGIVQQEQRTNGRRVVRIEIIQQDP